MDALEAVLEKERADKRALEVRSLHCYVPGFKTFALPPACRRLRCNPCIV